MSTFGLSDRGSPCGACPPGFKTLPCDIQLFLFFWAEAARKETELGSRNKLHNLASQFRNQKVKSLLYHHACERSLRTINGYTKVHKKRFYFQDVLAIKPHSA